MRKEIMVNRGETEKLDVRKRKIEALKKAVSGGKQSRDSGDEEKQWYSQVGNGH